MESLVKSGSNSNISTFECGDKEVEQPKQAPVVNVNAEKNAFMKEKLQEKKALIALQQSLKTQIIQVQKQARRIENDNCVTSDQILEMNKIVRTKELKTSTIARTAADVQRQVNELDFDYGELKECKEVLYSEL